VACGYVVPAVVLCLRRFFPLRLKKDLSHCARISYRLCVKKHVACGGLFSL
jgi:hypothetical protein